MLQLIGLLYLRAPVVLLKSHFTNARENRYYLMSCNVHVKECNEELRMIH